MTANRKPRKLKLPPPCRYCGFVSDTHAREGYRLGPELYSCRNAEECGERIRANKAAKGIPIDTSELPF